MIDICSPEEDAAFGEIVRDNYRLKRVINQSADGTITENKKPMKRQKPAHERRAEREAIERVVWGKHG